MKILDWMQRRLHPVSSNYTRLAPRNASAFEEDAGKITDAEHKSMSAVEIELGNEASLLHHALHGILSIGTLGHPHLHLFPEEEQQQEEEEEEEELKLDSPKTEPMAAEKPLIKITLLLPQVEMFMPKTEQSGKLIALNLADEKILTEEPLLKEDREKKQRTTLADLLSVDSASTGDEPSPAIAGATKSAFTEVHIISTASNSALKNRDKEKMNLIEKNKEGVVETSRSSGAAKRIRRMITRMMVKKKIHPVVETGGKEPPGKIDGGPAAVGVNLLLHSHGGLHA